MESITTDQLEDIVSRLVDGLQPERIYLYGSHADGSPHADSDIDILIIMPGSDSGLTEMYGRAEKCLRGTGLPAELVIFTSQEFERQRQWMSSLPNEIAKKGRLLYAA